MPARRIKEGVYSVGSQDWDRQIFDELIPLTQGTSYNSFFVEGNQKNALIDTVDPEKTDQLLKNLQELDLQIDYIVSNHAELDHSASIPHFLDHHQEEVVVTNLKCQELLKNFYSIPEYEFITIEDRETLSLGKKTLEFFSLLVHWPDSMVTYLSPEKILFSCDFFGSHLVSSQLYAQDHDEIYTAAKRYYAEIMMPFRQVIQKNLSLINELDKAIIALSKGPLHTSLNEIIDYYKKWVSDETSDQVIIYYLYMNGSTKKMVEYLLESLIKRVLSVKPFILAQMDLGEFLISLVDASTPVIASPTVLTGPLPLTVTNSYLINIIRPKLKYVAIMGSFGWGGRMEELIRSQLSNLKVEYLESIIIKGLPSPEDVEKIDALVEQIHEKHAN